MTTNPQTGAPLSTKAIERSIELARRVPVYQLNRDGTDDYITQHAMQELQALERELQRLRGWFDFRARQTIGGEVYVYGRPSIVGLCRTAECFEPHESMPWWEAALRGMPVP